MVDPTTPLPADEGDDAETICYCIGVSRGDILRAMREEGASTLEAVVRCTRAMGGCMTCRVDLEAIIDRERQRQRQRAGESS